MTDGHDAIVALIDAAKRLRAAADKLGDVETKAQILDVLVELQEMREHELLGEPSAATATDTQLASVESTSELPVVTSTTPLSGQIEQEPARLESSGEIETYTFALEQAAETADSTEPKENDTAASEAANSKASKKQRKRKPAQAEEAPNQNESTEDLSDEEKFALAEQRIADLEPLHQAALQRMNDVLTPEQVTKKAAATKKGFAAGLRGKKLQDAVFAVLELTEKQQHEIDQGRHELHRIRMAIGKQVEGLLSKAQLDQLLRSHRH